MQLTISQSLMTLWERRIVTKLVMGLSHRRADTGGFQMGRFLCRSYGVGIMRRGDVRQQVPYHSLAARARERY
jgi:hypothetical protein